MISIDLHIPTHSKLGWVLAKTETSENIFSPFKLTRIQFRPGSFSTFQDHNQPTESKDHGKCKIDRELLNKLKL